jgi:peptidoglycan/LPS O-acetylase OafA/YrhL
VKQLTQPLLVSSPTPTENRLDALLALRGLACLMVVIAHCHPPKAFLVYHTFDLSWLLFSAGGVAVRIFFCLSGYLMGKAFYTQRYTIDRSGILNFWRNRALRVFPLYYFSLIITSFWVYPDLVKFENWSSLLRIITFTYDQTLPIAFNGALWTLSTEVQFYFWVPFIFRYLQTKIRSKTQVLSLAFSIILGSLLLRVLLWCSIQSNFQPPEDAIAFVRYIYVPLWMNLDVFLGGFFLNVCLNNDSDCSQLKTNRIPMQTWHWQQKLSSRITQWSQLLSKKNAKINLRLISIIFLLLLYLLTAYLKYYNSESLGLISPTLTGLATCFFIYAWEKNSEPKKRDCCHRLLSVQACREHPWRILEVLGVLSYGIYIWHLPILAKIQPLLTSDIPIYAYFYRFFATLMGSTLLASITYLAIELPTANLKKFKPRSPLKN